MAPWGLTPDQQGHLALQTLDAAGLPNNFGRNSEETQFDRVVDGLELLAQSRLSSNRGHLGGNTDSGWKADKRVSLNSVRSLEDLERRLTSIQSNQHKVLRQVLTGLESVLMSCGYPPDQAATLAYQSGFYRLSRSGLTQYLGLHIHLYSLGQRFGYEYAVPEIQYHANKLTDIRAVHMTRLQVVAHSYCYLRNLEASKWQNFGIQSIRLTELQKATTPSITSEVTAETSSTTQASGQKFCNHCRTALHPGNRSACPFKEATATQAKLKGAEAIRRLAGME